jgi:hypothetical protein
MALRNVSGRLPGAMQQNLAVLVKNTDGHGTGMQSNATVQWVLGGVESHEVSSSS